MRERMSRTDFFAHLDELTTRVIREAIDEGVSEATETKALGSGS